MVKEEQIEIDLIDCQVLGFIHYMKELTFIPFFTRLLLTKIYRVSQKTPVREGFKKKKKVWNFPYFSGVGGFEKVIFHKK